jgi:hypothetical protein
MAPVSPATASSTRSFQLPLAVSVPASTRNDAGSAGFLSCNGYPVPSGATSVTTSCSGFGWVILAWTCMPFGALPATPDTVSGLSAEATSATGTRTFVPTAGKSDVDRLHASMMPVSPHTASSTRSFHTPLAISADALNV